MTTQFDAIVIGTGQAGPSLAGRLDREGLKTAIIERKLVGGISTSENLGTYPQQRTTGIRDGAIKRNYGRSFFAVVAELAFVEQERVHVLVVPDRPVPFYFFS